MIEQKLVQSIAQAIQALYGQAVEPAQVQLQKTKKEFEGHPRRSHSVYNY